MPEPVWGAGRSRHAHIIHSRRRCGLGGADAVDAGAPARRLAALGGEVVQTFIYGIYRGKARRKLRAARGRLHSHTRARPASVTAALPWRCADARRGRKAGWRAPAMLPRAFAPARRVSARRRHRGLDRHAAACRRHGRPRAAGTSRSACKHACAHHCVSAAGYASARRPFAAAESSCAPLLECSPPGWLGRGRRPDASAALDTRLTGHLPHAVWFR